MTKQSHPKPVIAIDVDEVLFPFTELFIEAHNEKHGTALRVADLEVYHYIEGLLGSNLSVDQIEDVIEDFIRSPKAASANPHAGSVAAIEKLKTKYQIVIISARRPSTRDVTEAWLKKHFADAFHDVHFTRLDTETETPKPFLSKKLGAVALIDDHDQNLKECVEAGVQGYYFGDYPWQEEMEGVTRVKDWGAVLKELL